MIASAVIFFENEIFGFRNAKKTKKELTHKLVCANILVS